MLLLYCQYTSTILLVCCWYATHMLRPCCLYAASMLPLRCWYAGGDLLVCCNYAASMMPLSGLERSQDPGNILPVGNRCDFAEVGGGQGWDSGFPRFLFAVVSITTHPQCPESFQDSLQGGPGIFQLAFQQFFAAGDSLESLRPYRGQRVNRIHFISLHNLKEIQVTRRHRRISHISVPGDQETFQDGTGNVSIFPGPWKVPSTVPCN